ncbi:MAG TPA: hypothetical protein VGX25_03275 [Actinophytocola sp.]|uniref:hypothetical protein n=1 Tax=Actinophytocola sp. TaxID=1872138 RepID=UPI002DDDA37B|nr:hypothetical protein [Actinophytocola sp.]HEV2778400.1 hypothetical protein [Actinophytocola sp.]
MLIVVCATLGWMGWRVHWAILGEGRPGLATIVMLGVVVLICSIVVAWCVAKVRRNESTRHPR